MSQTEPGTTARGNETDDGEQDDEISGVHPSLPLLVTHIAIGTMGSGSLWDGPVVVYATPYVLHGSERIRYARDYYLGTRFVTGVIPAEGWDDEMRGDGLPAFMIDECRDYLAAHAL